MLSDLVKVEKVSRAQLFQILNKVRKALRRGGVNKVLCIKNLSRNVQMEKRIRLGFNHYLGINWSNQPLFVMSMQKCLVNAPSHSAQSRPILSISCVCRTKLCGSDGKFEDNCNVKEIHFHYYSNLEIRYSDNVLSLEWRSPRCFSLTLKFQLNQKTAFFVRKITIEHINTSLLCLQNFQSSKVQEYIQMVTVF